MAFVDEILTMLSDEYKQTNTPRDLPEALAVRSLRTPGTPNIMPTTPQGSYTPADLRTVASTGGYAGKIRPEEAAGKIGVERSPGELAVRTQMDELVKRGQLDPRVAQMLLLNPQLGQALFKH